MYFGDFMQDGSLNSGPEGKLRHRACPTRPHPLQFENAVIPQSPEEYITPVSVQIWPNRIETLFNPFLDHRNQSWMLTAGTACCDAFAMLT